MLFPKLANETRQVIEVRCYFLLLLLSVTQYKCIFLKVWLSFSAPFPCRYCIHSWGCVLSNFDFFCFLTCERFWIRYRTVCIVPEELKIKTFSHAGLRWWFSCTCLPQCWSKACGYRFWWYYFGLSCRPKK